MAYQPPNDYGQRQGGYGQPSYGQPGEPSYGQPGQFGQQNYAQPLSPYDHYTPGGVYTGGAFPPTSPNAAASDTIGALFSKWINVVTHPSTATFEMEQPEATWTKIWISLGVYAVGFAIFQTIRVALFPTPFGNSLGSSSSGAAAIGPVGIFFGSLIFVPLGFMLGSLIYLGIAKLFKGQGNYMHQTYLLSLETVPLSVVSAAIGIIPFLGGVVAFGLSIYAIVLQVMAMKAAHRLSTGQSVGVVLIPLAIVFAIAAICAVVALAIFAAALHGTR